ncbi:restriction endonuclease subunit S [Enterococcus faecalis]|uniref:restriction endonuclease subunit S n=1 Tax=Enterococcus faecalis TaxID=1351 RepID=UPI0011597D6A|nr:restriction endonuclease subunit S [Enterococcus faecalis]EGO5967746.1 restriction endonuclease subunit S [Enterococcus faecalis]EJR1031491.1 restriction endonuclease subunit S [Enterococcus faecalis]MCK8535084.1 restriction endonuclease subunit S [Enterococcus faecalis]UYY14926.1 restriction endonuclease subunit S [Enterococcus faecalis]UZN28421.1 restriction endonuclease subunit S [Enterococcus faecalis]
MKKVPRLRFRGFSEDWEHRKVEELGDTFTGLTGKTKEDFGHGDATFVTYINVFSNPITDLKMTESVEIDAKQNQVEYGDIFFTTSSETPEEVGMSSVWLGNEANVYLNSFCFGYRPVTELAPYYMAFMLRSPNVRKKFIFLAQGISRYNISKNRVMDIEIPVPNIDEQRKVGQFFKDIDDLITLHQRKLDQLKELKKAYLQLMFPKKDETVPRVRFADFEDDWQLCKLGETFSIIMGQSPNSENYTENPDDYILVQGNSDMKNNKVVPRIWTTQVTKKAEKGDLILSVRAPVGEIGKTDYNVVLGRGVAAVKGNDFIFQQLRKMKDSGYWTRYSTGSTFESINSNDIKEALINIPNKDEQQKIGDLFTHLDDAIILNQNKLNQLKSLKKSYLQNMFI